MDGEFYGEKPENPAICGGGEVQSLGLPQSGGLGQFTARP
jgi:hypothetical protein